jgi:hypothetical protein
MERRIVYALSAMAFAVLVLLALSGCLKGPTYAYEYAISDPYDISSGVIEMKVNATARILINNSGGGELMYWVSNATLTAYGEDGSKETVAGRAEDGIVPAGGTSDLVLEFIGVPVRYVLLDGPPRFHPLISHYDVNVTTGGRTKLVVFWSPAAEESRSMRIPVGDVPVGEYLGSLKDTIRPPASGE